MNTEREAISVLQGRVKAAASVGELRRLARVLAGDARVGARALSLRCEARAQRMEREAVRLRRLFALCEKLRAGGARYVAGVDEVGVGPLAGPVVAAAVVLPARPSLAQLAGLDDSKKLSPAQRQGLAVEIRAQAIALGLGSASPREIDRVNIYQAALLAMRRAVQALPIAADHLLVDARRIPDVPAQQTALVRGDSLDGAIAAASIVAKVHRDALMQRLDARFPGYGFARHKGYATAEHLAALRRAGATPLHRRSFAPVAAVLERGKIAG